MTSGATSHSKSSGSDYMSTRDVSSPFADIDPSTIPVIEAAGSSKNPVIEALINLEDEVSKTLDGFRDQSIVPIPDEPCPLAVIAPSTSKPIYHIYVVANDDIDKPTKDYLLSMMELISDWVLHSKLSNETLNHQAQVSEYLKMIGG